MLSTEMRCNVPLLNLQVIFGTFYAKGHLSGHALGIPGITGMSFLFKKSVMDELGGLAHFANTVAEDTLISKAVLAHGYQIEFSSQPAWQNPPPAVSLRNYHARNVRYNCCYF
jgi:ceramide glucosyltransferase